ncbi:YkvA family protein [Gracilibacillus kekensis]|uniref:Uncharacterized membrane protein YkvA, DUF1232 family n=1 Tax=Gracilibacillus kekensis TaxID=1027249 RepID=A0A1M7L4A9_9BACI|nr:YkvA family protein [Gracilibacillus kekensis]SHM72110.1 Uncharacterized membrane protein YkvA, DUF1232 family [Gracilibacillus kekensis]
MPKAKNFEQGYKKYTNKAKEYFQNKKKSENLLNEAVSKANQKKGRLEEVWKKLQLLLEMFRSWIKGEYKEIPKGSIMMIIATILYFVTPIDLIPDFIVGLGFFDDAAVIGFAIKQISDDIDRYITWKNNQKSIEQDKKQ